MSDGRQPHLGIKIPGRVAMVYHPKKRGPTLYNTYDQQPEDEDDDEGGRQPGQNQPDQADDDDEDFVMGEDPQSLSPSLSPGPPPPTPSPPPPRNRPAPASNQARGTPHQHRRRQSPAQHPGSLESRSEAGVLFRPPPPEVMMWDPDLQAHAEQMTGWEDNDPDYRQTGSVRLVGKVPSDEYNLEELLETVAGEMGTEPEDIALIDHTRFREVIQYSRDLERQNRSLKRQLRRTGLEPSV
ncbi:hypothetical protein BKA65DRAFT_532087 [Rhexocercosporidium sp. MPI-PUGE-AT-0058]|nr:hypothetical protein BKA65DRAFT_532087 [Rhexocercosporidium sp. MPI-PUGE-AT-0058]